MKERNKKKHLEEANGKDQKKQKEKVDTKPQNLLLYKAEAAGSAARECGGEQKYPVEEKMDGQIEKDSDESARDAEFGEKDDGAAAEGVGAVEENDGDRRKERGVHPRKEDKEKDGRGPRDPLQKDEKDAPLGKDHAVKIVGAELIVIPVKGRARGKTQPEEKADRNENTECDERLFALRGAGETVFEAKKKVHIP